MRMHRDSVTQSDFEESVEVVIAGYQRKGAIVPRTSGALGYTMQVSEDDNVLMSKEELFNKITTLTGGRSAEEVIFKSITTGASNDIEQATRIARAMVTRFGMTDEFDMMATETVTNAYLVFWKKKPLPAKNLCIFWNTAGRKPKTKLPVKLLIQPQQRLTKVQKPKNLTHRQKKRALRNKLYLLD